MKPSERCYEFIKEFEGLRLNSYKDVVGIWTIGYGSIMYPDGSKVKSGETITKERADEMLEWEINIKAKSVDVFLSKCVISQNNFDALVSFAFNLGMGALQKSTLLKKVIKNPKDETIRSEFMKWNNAGGKPVAGLTRRRKSEADFYFS